MPMVVNGCDRVPPLQQGLIYRRSDPFTLGGAFYMVLPPYVQDVNMYDMLLASSGESVVLEFHVPIRSNVKT